MMKKAILILLSLVLSVSMFACSKPVQTAETVQTAAQATELPPENTAQPTDAPAGEHEHVWEKGVCTVCGEVCAHEWESGRCTICRLRCPHEQHDPETLQCTVCGRAIQHNYIYTDYVNGVCSMCGKTTQFIWEFGKIDESLKAPCEHAGTIEKVTYDTHAYAAEAQQGRDDLTLEKTMYVYLPYGYSADKSYNVLYLMHGGGENEGYWFGVGDYYPEWFEKYQATNCVVHILDNMIEKGLIDPLIVVTVSFYSNINGVTMNQLNLPAYFASELKNDIIPTITEKYATYATGTTHEELTANREHTGYAGFSMGSMTGFQGVMQNALDYVGWIGNYSAGYGADETAQSNETGLGALIQKLKTEYAEYPLYYWFNGNGTMDMAHDGHVLTYQKMLEALPERFVEGENCIFIDLPGGGHTYPAWEIDLYNTLLVFFR